MQCMYTRFPKPNKKITNDSNLNRENFSLKKQKKKITQHTPED